MFSVLLMPEVKKYYERSGPAVARKLARCFNQLESEPFHHPNIKRLKGNLSGSLRYRIGDLRVIYRVLVETKTVEVQTVAHRSEVYE